MLVYFPMIFLVVLRLHLFHQPFPLLVTEAPSLILDERELVFGRSAPSRFGSFQGLGPTLLFSFIIHPASLRKPLLFPIHTLSTVRSPFGRCAAENCTLDTHFPLGGQGAALDKTSRR